MTNAPLPVVCESRDRPAAGTSRAKERGTASFPTAAVKVTPELIDEGVRIVLKWIEDDNYQIPQLVERLYQVLLDR
jgi:hypothetical protein